MHDKGAEYNKYLFYKGRTDWPNPDQRASVLFDNGTESSMTIHFPHGETKLEIKSKDYAVVIMHSMRFEFEVSSGSESSRSKFAFDLQGGNSCFIYNHEARNSYLIEKKSYAITNSSAFAGRDRQYEVSGKTQFQSKYYPINFFFKPLPDRARPIRGFPSTTKVRISRQ